MLRASSFTYLALAAAASTAAISFGFGCSSSSDTPAGSGAGPTSTTSPASSTQATGTGGSTSAGGGGSSACGDDPMLPEQVLDDTDPSNDPEQGMFTIDQALDGLPDGPGPLRAIITTELGTLTCALRDDVAPDSVANFVGLARGKRAFFDTTMDAWVRRRFYDGLTWHRVIPQFVAQGGDPAGNGTGGPGYTIDFEVTGLTNIPGALAYASTGPMSNTAGSQFYVVAEVAQPSLDGDYAVFGLCDPVSVVTALTDVPRDANDKPITPIHMTTIAVTRCAP